MEKFAVDTTAIIKYLKTVDGVLADVLGQYELVISAVTVTELLTSKRVSDSNARKQLTGFLKDNFTVVPVSNSIAERAGDILRDSTALTLAHALVAATAITEKAPLISYETNIYDNVPDLELVDI